MRAKQRPPDRFRVPERFRLTQFSNPRTGSMSWRVSGTKRDGTRVRENFPGAEEARNRQVELEGEFLARQPDEPLLRATRLTDVQIRLAETAFMRLDKDEDLLNAVDHWLNHGKHVAVAESPRLDDAVTKFGEWLDTTDSLRDLSKRNLRVRVKIFASSVGNHRVADVTPEHIEKFLSSRSEASAATRDNDKRAISRFFSWCMERPRFWVKLNPCTAVRIEKPRDDEPPSILTVDECEKLLRAAQKVRGGETVPYIAVCLFAGIRPSEASRLTWDQVNLDDGEIRLEANQTKTGAPRVFEIVPTLQNGKKAHAGPDTLLRWLKAYKDKPFAPSRRAFDALKRSIGYAGRGDEDLKPWPVDVLRHTAISHYFRLTGSYGQTAEQFGNSEAIIKAHYQGRVSSDDTKKFYAIKPSRKRQRK
jgi:integrase